MKVNFNKSDRLIELLESSCLILSGYNFGGAYRLKHSENPAIRNLYSELVDITHSDISEEEKNLQRINLFAKAYGHENDLEFGERMLKHTFDEDRILEYLTRVYWQIQPFVKFTDETGNNFSDTDMFRQFIKKWYPDELCKEVMIDVIRNQEPDVKAIEAEFWANCSDTDKINDWCNIYRERFNNYLKEVDEKLYEDVLYGFDETIVYHQYFKYLRLTGLLKQREVDVEARLWHIAQSINIISNKIVELFKGLRASAQNTIITNSSILDKENPDNEKLSHTNNYEIRDYKKIQAIFDLCNDEFFESDFVTFRESIEKADFSKINIKRQTITQDLIYRLSGILDKDWLAEVENNMGWKRGLCGGRNSKVKEYPEIRRLDKLISRPSKKVD